MKLTIKLISAFLVFVAPVILILQRYDNIETRIETSFGLLPTLFVITVLAVGFTFVSQQFMEMVRTNKFGFLSIVFFGVLLGILLFAGVFTLSAILNTAQANFDAFKSNYEYHIDTLQYALYFVASGIAVSGVYLLSQLKRPFK